MEGKHFLTLEPHLKVFDGLKDLELTGGAESVKEEEKEMVVNSIESYYKENATEENRETLKENINAIAAIFGKDLTADFDLWDSEGN